MGDSKGFNTWFEAYQYMEQQILQIEFDVAIVGCKGIRLSIDSSHKKGRKTGDRNVQLHTIDVWNQGKKVGKH